MVVYGEEVCFKEPMGKHIMKNLGTNFTVILHDSKLSF